MTHGPFATLLYVQWKQQRTELIALTLVCAALAPVSLWSTIDRTTDSPQWLMGVIGAASTMGPAAALIAAATGFLLAVRPYWLDARVRHTYPLALPLTRTAFALRRAGGGLVLAALPAAGLLIGALVASAALPDDARVRAFPVELAVRFLLAAATAFSAFFAVQYGLGNNARRRILLVAVTIVAFEIFGQLAFHTSLTEPTLEVLKGRFSPVRLFIDHWTLFNV
jgi:hypothetical protein